MNPVPFIGRALVAASLCAALGGCELLKRNGEAQGAIGARLVGMPAGDFFDRFGRAQDRREGADGTTQYDWISSVDYAPPGPDGLDDRICKLRVVADKRGRIAAVHVLYDAPGKKSTSRCGELFAAP